MQASPAAPDQDKPKAAPLRKLKTGSNAATIERRADGVIVVRPSQPLGPYPARLTERLVRFAAEAPERVFIAERDATGEWRKITYAQAFHAAKAIGSALLQRRVSPERPLMILSGNDVDHALLALACLHVGLPYAPISPAYSAASSDFSKLRHIARRLTPGLIFANDGDAFAAALKAVAPGDTEVVVSRNPPPGLPTTPFAQLLEFPIDEEAIARAHDAVRGDDVAKILFTSGSTALPKGVINTHAMWTANQEMIANYFRFLRDVPPVIVDWLPWNHTFGGNHNFGLVLYNGGSLYIDEGRPTPKGILATVRNLREIAPSAYFNVPKGFEELVPFLRAEPALREKFFSRLHMNFFAGAGLAQHVWDALDAVSVEAVGERVPMMTGLGATESGPFAMVCAPEHCRSGYVGLPVPGVVLKLAPVEGKLEVRLRGPSITRGYWRDPEANARSYDDEGYYCLGDAVKWIDEADPTKGFEFDGRITEDFKLSTGTWVSVGPMRAKIIAHFAPYFRDVAIAGINRDDLAVLAFPDIDACRALCPDLSRIDDPGAVFADARVRKEIRRLLVALAAGATGSSTRIARALLLEAPPSLDKGEITDKGSINQRAVLTHRADLVEELYARPYSPRIVTMEEA
ncbi:feruloyl-CoA synthase [Methylocapsa sp. S129]|uniref:feruloyl-CoA synthase n=1 Tax=Methylocapsa sp. S129 TaxID=1641869 RepID=UPI00131AD054|nr:feruloyl-CoA synthase [Methylocapsa sp. S129]